MSPVDKDHVKKLRKYGWDRYDVGEFGKGIVAFDEAIRLHRRSADAHKGRGLCRLARKEYDLAIRDLNESAAISPRDADVFFHRAAACWEIGRENEAIGDLDRVLMLAPKHPQASAALADIAGLEKNAPPPLPMQKVA